MRFRWSHLRDWAALGVLTLVACALTYLLFGAAVEKGVTFWARLLLPLVFVLAIAAAWFSRPSQLSRTRLIGSRARGKWLAFLILAFLTSMSFAIDALSLFAPRPAVESAAGAIERKVDAIGTRLPSPATSARIREKFAGIWGEPDCAVSFRFAIQGDALVITNERAPAGAPPYRADATITHAQADVLEARGEDFRAAKFSYSTNGVAEQLVWDDARETPPSKYRRCPPVR